MIAIGEVQGLSLLRHAGAAKRALRTAPQTMPEGNDIDITAFICLLDGQALLPARIDTLRRNSDRGRLALLISAPKTGKYLY